MSDRVEKRGNGIPKWIQGRNMTDSMRPIANPDARSEGKQEPARTQYTIKRKT